MYIYSSLLQNGNLLFNLRDFGCFVFFVLVVFFLGGVTRAVNCAKYVAGRFQKACAVLFVLVWSCNAWNERVELPSSRGVLLGKQSADLLTRFQSALERTVREAAAHAGLDCIF